MNTTKICFKCKRNLPIGQFYAHPRMEDGHLNKCKDCCKADNRQNRQAKLEFYHEYDKRRSSLPHRIQLRTAARLETRKMNPQKYFARTKAGNALRDGRLIKHDHCYFCNSDEHLEMHHPDYSQPLRVYWICRSCHRKLDSMMKLGIPQNHDGDFS